MNGMKGQETMIQIIELVDHFFDGKLVFDQLLAALAKPAAQRWVASEFDQVIYNGRHITGSNQKTGFAVQTDFVCSVEIVRNNRLGSGQGLWQCA